jgi:DNA-binding NarL/FixJ family response regulator
MLGRYPDIEIVGQAADGEAAVRMAKKLKPDVILMDISMPGMNGIEATRIIHSELPYIRIIGLSMHDKQDHAARMIEAGASAYCTKDGETAKLLSVIRGG